jgi:2-oxoisovalerate dehydrogenase E1 component beta subunit
MWEEMERDPSVFMIGEDIGVYGGAFKATKGFQQHFGEERVIDSVLSEAAIVGAAAGAAVVGMRPIVEIQFADFVSTAFNQIVTNCAKIHYRWSLPAPMVIRLPNGGYIRGGPYHSSSTEAWFFHVPGLKIVAPSTPYDAKGLMKAAIRDNSPVLYVESKYLYRRIKGEVSEGDYIVELGKADVKRNGSDIALITYGATVHHALEAAEILAKEDGVEVLVLDLRTLMPLDKDAIFDAVKATGKVLIVHEDLVTGGVGAEISALIAENMFRNLDALIKRVGALDVPVPFAPTLEDFVLPNTGKVVRALRELAAF